MALYLAQATVFRFDAIAVGLALSASGIRCDARMRPFIAIVSVAVIVLAGGWLYGLGGGLSQTFGFSLAAVGCGGLLLASIGARWMRNGWMGYLGHISYGLYVFHLPIIVITQVLVPRFAVGPTSLLFAVGVAAVSYS